MTGHDLLLEAAALGPLKGGVRIQQALENEECTIVQLVTAAKSYHDETSKTGLHPDTPEDVAIFLTDLRESLLR